MVPPSSQSSPPQQQQQPESSITLQSTTLPQAQTGAQQLQVTHTAPLLIFEIQHIKFCALHVCSFSKSFFSLLWTHNSHYHDCPFYFFFHSSPLHAAYSCMTFSLGPMIQVLLSCLLHSTQSTYTSSIRPHASLFCRYSTEYETNSCGPVYVGQVWSMWYTPEVCVHSSFKTISSGCTFYF